MPLCKNFLQTNKSFNYPITVKMFSSSDNKWVQRYFKVQVLKCNPCHKKSQNNWWCFVISNSQLIFEEKKLRFTKNSCQNILDFLLDVVCHRVRLWQGTSLLHWTVYCLVWNFAVKMTHFAECLWQSVVLLNVSLTVSCFAECIFDSQSVTHFAKYLWHWIFLLNIFDSELVC